MFVELGPDNVLCTKQPFRSCASVKGKYARDEMLAKVQATVLLKVAQADVVMEKQMAGGPRSKREDNLVEVSELALVAASQLPKHACL